MLCFTETFVKTGEEKNIYINNYELGANYSRDKKRGSSCIIDKKGIEHKKVSCFDDLAMKYCFEPSAVNLTLNNIIVISMYRNSSKSKRHIEYVLEKLDLLKKLDPYKCNRFPNKKNILIGDFNINILETNPHTTRMFDILKN